MPMRGFKERRPDGFLVSRGFYGNCVSLAIVDFKVHMDLVYDLE